MLGGIMSIIAGSAMALQGVINTRLNEKIGLYESNVFAQASALVIGLIFMWIFGKGNITQIVQVNKVYWLGGVLGAIIVITVMLAISNLSPTRATAVILIAQLFTAAVIDAFGWLNTEKVPFDWSKWVGLGLMVAGVLLFKWERAA
jgi:transporter family-2 protein